MALYKFFPIIIIMIYSYFGIEYDFSYLAFLTMIFYKYRYSIKLPVITTSVIIIYKEYYYSFSYFNF